MKIDFMAETNESLSVEQFRRPDLLAVVEDGRKGKVVSTRLKYEKILRQAVRTEAGIKPFLIAVKENSEVLSDYVGSIELLRIIGEDGCFVARQFGTSLLPVIGGYREERPEPGENKSLSDCRLQRKMQFRNYQNLTQRPCSQCGKLMISMYPEVSKATVWCEACWSADTWDAQDFALIYDSSQPFLKQFAQLSQSVPQQHLNQKNNENSPWVNHETRSKNCYMNFGGLGNEDGAYNQWSGFTSNCLDNYALLESQLCYETIVATKCYQTFFSTFVFDCRDVLYSENCSDCSNVIGCINLKSKSSQIFNQRLTKIHPPTHTTGTTDSTGDYLEHSHDCLNCFTTAEVQSCTNSVGIGYIKDCYDIFSGFLGMELCYEYTGAGEKCYKVSFSSHCEASHDIYYSHSLTSCHDCFGCVGLANKQFCILNTQYTEEEYKALVPKVIQQMNQLPYIDSLGRTYPYGEFFPGEISPFPYNDSVAQDFFPLTKTQTVSQGFHWRDVEQSEHVPSLSASALPDRADQADYSLLKEIISCAHQGTCTDHCVGVFTIIKSELDFLKRFGLPLPRLCPNCRHIRRIKQKNPMKLWERVCQCAGESKIVHQHGTKPCSNSFATTLAPDKPEIVYCQECFLAETV